MYATAVLDWDLPAHSACDEAAQPHSQAPIPLLPGGRHFAVPSCQPGRPSAASEQHGDVVGSAGIRWSGLGWGVAGAAGVQDASGGSRDAHVRTLAAACTAGAGQLCGPAAAPLVRAQGVRAGSHAHGGGLVLGAAAGCWPGAAVRAGKVAVAGDPTCPVGWGRHPQRGLAAASGGYARQGTVVHFWSEPGVLGHDVPALVQQASDELQPGPLQELPQLATAGDRSMPFKSRRVEWRRRLTCGCDDEIFTKDFN